MNIYLALELPVNVRIDYNLVPRLPKNRIAQRMVMAEAVLEVRKALQAWYYQNG